MKIFKTKKVKPIGKSFFRAHILVSFIIQVIFVALSWVALNFFQIGIGVVNSIFLFAALLGIHFFFLFYIYDFNKYKGRFKDIYPKYNLTATYYFLTGFFPFAFIVFTAFLCLKESHDPSAPRKIFKTLYLIPVLIALLGLQVVSPTIAYWSAGPSQYYVVDVLHDSIELMVFKRKASYRPDLFEEFQSKHHGKLSSTQLVLLLAVNASLLIKEKNSAVKSDETNLKYGLKLVEFAFKSLSYSENSKLSFMDYSPIHWLHPSGPVEIYLLQMVEGQILLKFNAISLEKGMNILNGLKKGADNSESPNKTSYLEKIDELQKRFEQTETFKNKKK